LVWFGFQSLKPIEPNWFNQASTKKKASINRMFPNPKPKVTFNPLSQKCLLSSSPPFLCSLHLPLHFSSLIFLHAQLHDCYLLVVKFKLLQPPPLPILCLSSLKVKSVFFSSMISISISHLSDLHVLGPNVVALWCLTVLVGSSVGQDLLTLLFNSFPAASLVIAFENASG